MKKTVSVRPHLTALSLGLALSWLAVGQNAGDQPKPTTPPAPTATTPAPRSETPHYDLDIENGVLKISPAFASHFQNATGITATLANVVEMLRLMHDSANIVLSPSVGDITISDLKLKGVNLEDELDALRVASGDQFIWTHGAPATKSAAIIDPNTGLPVPPPEQSSAFYSLVPNPAARPATNQHGVEVFNLGPYIKQQKDANQARDEVVQMIAQAVDFANQGQSPAMRPNFQYFPGGQLLIVAGPPEVLDVARKVVRALTGEAIPEPAPMRGTGYGFGGMGGGMMGGYGGAMGMGGMGMMGGGMMGGGYGGGVGGPDNSPESRMRARYGIPSPQGAGPTNEIVPNVPKSAEPAPKR